MPITHYAQRHGFVWQLCRYARGQFEKPLEFIDFSELLAYTKKHKITANFHA